MNKKIIFLITLISNIYVGSLINMHVPARISMYVPARRTTSVYVSNSKNISQQLCPTQQNLSSYSDIMYIYNTHHKTVTIDDCEYAIDEKASHQILKEESCADGESEFLIKENKYSRIGLFGPWTCNGFCIEKRKTQSTTKMLPYLSKMGTQSVLFSIADNKEVKKAFAEVINDENHNHTVRLLQTLDDYLKAAYHGNKSRINPIQVGRIKDVLKSCGLAIPPLLIIAGSTFGYYTGNIDLAIFSFLAGIHPITLGGCVVLPNLQEHPNARDSILILLHGQDKNTKQKVMQQFFALADDLYREGKKNFSYYHE